MQLLYPERHPFPLEELHAGLTLRAGEPRAWLAIDMVTSLDGAASVDGRTAQLGGEADHLVFRRLRGAADAILVGAGTVRHEDYGPASGTEQRRRERAARGLRERPRLVVVSRSLDIDPGSKLFGDPHNRPLVVTVDRAPAERVAAIDEVADVVRLGAEAVDLPALLTYLHDVGLPRVLCEGGPTLNAGLLAADLIDEIFLTVAPSMFGGDAPRIVAGGMPVPGRGYDLVSVHEHENELLLRYRRAR